MGKKITFKYLRRLYRVVFDPSSLIHYIDDCEENQFLFKNKNLNLDYISGVKSLKNMKC